MELFDIIGVMFEDHSAWVKVTNYDKKKNFFMINRILSIKYPLQANMLQHLKVNQVAVIDFWFYFISSQYNRKPSWLYTKASKKKDSTKKSKKNTITEDMIKTFAHKLGYEVKTVRMAIEFFGEEILTEIKDIDKLLNG